MILVEGALGKIWRIIPVVTIVVLIFSLIESLTILPAHLAHLKDDSDDAAAYLRSSENPFISIAFDPKGRTAIDWGVTAPPETFIIDQTGKVVFRFAGPLIGADYENRFLPNLKAALSDN